jgi:hypothetical protein
METVREYDVHEDLRRKVHEVTKRLIALEERVWALKDELYHHEHDGPTDDECREAAADLAEAEKEARD